MSIYSLPCPSSVSLQPLPYGDHHPVVRVHQSKLLLVFIHLISHLKQICCLTPRHAQPVNAKNKSEKNVLQERGPETEAEPRCGSEPVMWAEPQVTG